jgi:hypothetical protein
VASPFGISDDAFKKSAGKTLNEVVEDWGNIAMNDLRESLQSKVKLTTSKGLEQSILAQPIAFDGKTLSVSITALPYADYLNEGVQGVGGEMKNGSRWVNKSPGSPFSFKKDKKPSVKHFVQWSYLASKNPFAVRETVFRSGIRANHFIDDVVNGEFKKQFAEALSKVMGRAIEVDITLDFKK